MHKYTEKHSKRKKDFSDVCLLYLPLQPQLQISKKAKTNTRAKEEISDL
jgi:hypothetical protein